MENVNRFLYCADFETTVESDTSKQEKTEVWSACINPLFEKEDPKIYENISDFMKYFIEVSKYMYPPFKTRNEMIVYFHNLKFDGSFILYYLLTNENKYHDRTQEDIPFYKFDKGDYCYLISSDGAWYSITLCVKKRVYVKFVDSLKILPFSVKVVGQSFKTKHQKLEMDYKRHDRLGVPITEEEREYIKNDVLVMKEALESFITNQKGDIRLTIGGYCKNAFYKDIDNEMKDAKYPNLYEIKIDEEVYGSENAGDYIRKSYRGGWCYVNEKYQDKKYVNITGSVADVNSLYPSMMHSESGNRYPVGSPIFFHGEVPEDVRDNPNYFYFVRFTCDFNLKENYLPFMQFKGRPGFNGREMLKNNINLIGERDRNPITLTGVDFELFKKHYDITKLKVLDGCYFNTEIGIFDNYINYYKKLKIEASKNGNKGLRTLAKLFLNNLYGQMSTSPVADYKVATIVNGRLAFIKMTNEEGKEPGYIAIGSAITSYARRFTITAAQKNYDKFMYADTDSIHCMLPASEVKGIKIDDNAFCCWKIENEFDKCKYVRAKTYIEHMTKEDGKDIDPYYNVKCAGMPKNVKTRVVEGLDGFDVKFEKDETPIKDLDDFDVNMVLFGKLMPRQVEGGTLLKDTSFRMRK